MTLSRYDKAITEKIKEVFPNVEFTDEPQALENTQTNANPGGKAVQIRLPLITIDRISNKFNMKDVANDVAMTRGFKRPTGEDSDVRVREIPVDIVYQINIWSNKRFEVDTIWGELLDFLITERVLKVHFEGLALDREYTLKVLDSSMPTDYKSHDYNGKLFRQTLDVAVDFSNLLFKNRVNLVKEIPIRVYSYDGKELIEEYEVKDK